SMSILSPIILDLGGDGVRLTSVRNSDVRFDMNTDGRADATGWIGQGDAFLFLDRDGDGTVSGADELSFVDDKADAASDLDGLAVYDSNHDGKLSAADSRFADFHLW